MRLVSGLALGTPRMSTPEFSAASYDGTPSVENLYAHIHPDHKQWEEIGTLFQLSPQQLKVAKLLFADCPDKNLARQLGCAPSTARVHRAKLYEKVGVVDRTGLVRKIIEFCVGHPAGRKLPPPPISEHLRIGESAYL